ncbi:hypothetical protein HPB48_002004 [Haemaphysalis longicornis]|uniref:Amino acid transporter n=1 Tax=Haemaphysalis longicornis TaxID=44386 RepID=A0A9J6FVH0_HAELO|nr:hypothetical protein HPB48_002004 [Haemaphysalis longicornis]
MYVAFPGDVLLRLLRLSVLPLITASIVAAIGGVDLLLAGRLGRRAFIYYMVTTVIAEIEGIILVFLIRPGSVGTPTDLARAPPKRVFYIADAVMDIIRCAPRWLRSALFEHQRGGKAPYREDGCFSRAQDKQAYACRSKKN